MKPNTIIFILLGIEVAGAMGLGYLVLRPSGAAGSLVLGGAGLVLIAAAIGPILAGRMRKAPAAGTLSAADVWLCIFLAAIGCGLAVAGVISGMWWLMALGILLAPLVFAFRGVRVQRD